MRPGQLLTPLAREQRRGDGGPGPGVAHRHHRTARGQFSGPPSHAWHPSGQRDSGL